MRIKLYLKRIDYNQARVRLIRDRGRHSWAAYRAISPYGLVPSLTCYDGSVLMQSLGIFDYLDERSR